MRKNWYRTVLAGVLLSLSLVLTQEAAAMDLSVDEASAQEVADGMANKAVRGVANVATGWLELPKQIGLTVKEEGFAKGLTVGPIKGVAMFAARTLAGAAETFTFFHPSPGFYDPIVTPSYVWQSE